jgi:hypothetical protein
LGSRHVKFPTFYAHTHFFVRDKTRKTVTAVIAFAEISRVGDSALNAIAEANL